MLDQMHAIRVHEFGDPNALEYETAPRPEPAADELLVRVHAAGVNSLDCLLRRGIINEPPLPWIPGYDLSGVVETVGADVTAFEAGDAVYGQVGGPPGLGNTYAEYAAVPAAGVVRVPEALDHTEAAAVPMVALTAWQALFDKGELSEGDRVLFHGAAGGVGHIAVQLANWRGATVIGTGSAHSEDFLSDLGVDEFVNYREERFEDVVGDIDLVIDTQGGDTRERSFEVLSEGGTLVSLKGQPSEELIEEYGVYGRSVFAQPDAATLTKITDLLEAGTLDVTVSSVRPLAEAKDAHEQVEDGHTRGKRVLRVAE
ncbi:NADP-dependent oxidoreductase [Haladaptatus sp. SPP-AMP-3]|uniref:NADP-dependent oxidoreductase n=1 Tax=Haladaptatus sp. SPP-AMP-3 TaxID=3121295 RepID=UPI003C2C8E64